MHTLLAIWIVAVGPTMQTAAHYREAAEVFTCDFGSAWDRDFDAWPDHWRRQHGSGYPRYVSVKIAQQHASPAKPCLRIDLDGGGAIAFSPDIPVGSLYSYVLEGRLKTERLINDQAFLSVTFLDKDRRRLDTFHSPKVCESRQWETLRLGPFASRDPAARFAVIGLHVEPQSTADLKGTAMFSDLWLGRLPRIAIATNGANNLFLTSEHVEITCHASGFTQKHPRVVLRLCDVLGRPIAEQELALKTHPAGTSNTPLLDNDSDALSSGEGTVSWKPPIPGPGYYRVEAAIRGRQALILHQELSLAVIEPVGNPARGEFGWSLPRGDRPVPVPVLSRWLGQMGVNWLKYPLWYDEKASDAQIERLIDFLAVLNAQGIEVVGLLADPPASVRKRLGESTRLTADDIFAASPDLWYPSLEHVLMRLATQVHWWQLGYDHDTSFVGDLNLKEKLTQVKTRMDRVGQDVRLGIGWGWMDERPDARGSAPPLRFLTLSADPPLTQEALAEYLPAAAKSGAASHIESWVCLDPLSRERYPLETRANDLVRRMMTAKLLGAEAIFIPDPCNTDRGLLNDDGTPGELLLPWRTTSQAIGGARCLGSLQLPGGSQNLIFTRDGETVMLVWSDKPTRESLYLGEDVRQRDLWGRTVQPPNDQGRQVIEAGPLPTVVAGLHEAITRWSMDFTFAQQRIPSVFGRAHKNTLKMTNTFPRGLSGRVSLVAPAIWTLAPREFKFQMQKGESFEQPFAISLPYDTASGRQMIRADVELLADRTYHFSVYRSIDVNLGDVTIDIVSHLNHQGELEVRQELINGTDEFVSFDCQLFVPGRQRLRTQVVNFARGNDTKIYRLADGKDLLGQRLWLKAQEVGGPRTLNYRFVAGE